MSEMVFNIFVFVLFTALWIAFGAALVFSRGSLDSVWQSFRALPLVVQLLGWLLFLPITLGLWIWETAWPIAVRLVLVMSLAWWNIFVFFPRR